MRMYRLLLLSIMKRAIDIIISFSLLVVVSPALIPLLWLIYLQDRKNPFYVAPRVGKKGVLFPMIKLRTMVVGADRSGVDSTSSNDSRITPLGHWIRRYKLDELPQLINVLIGQMSLVGPRPNVKRETDIYTQEERHLLDIAPGITDIASIVFSDEGEILRNSQNPDLDFNQRIRPWKSRLGLLYVRENCPTLDLILIFLTALSLISRPLALRAVGQILVYLGADEILIDVAKRQTELASFPPPGALEIVTSRNLCSTILNEYPIDAI